MKKVTLFLLSLIVSFTAFSQLKHNKFTTRITFDQFNPNPEYWKTSVSEIPNNQGYFLSNFYDDQAYGFHPSLVKLDVDGKIVFDSLYEYTPFNFNGFTNVVGSTTSDSSHTVLYQTGSLGSQMTPPAPYFINYDMNGNVNWHTGFTNDTLELVVNKLIPTKDGGYVATGTLYDWFNIIYPVSGYAIKIDSIGNMLWHQMYANKDTMEIRFENGLETPDGGFIHVGMAQNMVGGQKPGGGKKQMGVYDIPTSIVRTDDVGNVLWSKVTTFDAPVDNEYFLGNFSVGMLNDTNAFISVSTRDSSGGGQDIFAITSININNGNRNWVKIYSLPPGENINARKAISDGKGHIIVSASYYGVPATGVLFVMDENGNVMDTKRFSHMTANFPYETITTQDGGFVHISEIDQNEILMVKTDEFLDPSCPTIDSTFMFSLDVMPNNDTSYFGMLDSVYTLPSLAPLQMPFGSQVATSSDDSLICSCNNTIYGNVIEGGATPVNNAKVYLYRKGMVPYPWQPIDSTITDVAGYYMFEYLPADSFIVRVDPDTSLFPGAMTSYYNSMQLSYKWDSAEVFHIHCDSAIIQRDIQLVVPPVQTGNSSLNGYVFESFGSFQKNQLPGDPIPGIDITVDQSPGGVVGGATTNSSGYYSLTGLNTNTTYVVTIDYPGLPHDSIWTVNVNLSDTTMDSLNFYIDSTGIYILDQPINTSVNVIETSNLDVDIYPNPSNDMFTISINAIKPEIIELQLTDKIGKIISVSSQKIIEGSNNIIFDEAKNLPSGIYFLKIREGNNHHIKKIVKL